MVDILSIENFRELFGGESEFAVVDPRPRREFAAGHLLAASNLPLDEIRASIRPVVPCLDTLCVLCDDGGGEAARAAASLESIAYSNVALLDGGLAGWRDGGGAVFSGTSVPGKAFGEFIEKSCATPAMSAAELYRLQQRGEQPLLIDSRTAEEHSSYCIPGARLCPGAELLYRIIAVELPQAPIVVHCGGRTRSIVGAQTLIDAGFEDVYALENGTMAWQFENLELERGNRDELAVPGRDALARAVGVAEALARRWGIERLESIPPPGERTRYLLDVRGREEFESAHVAGSRQVPGGHLLQNVDRYLVVRNAEVVLVDSDRVRAVTTATWLKRMGWRRLAVYSIDAGAPSLRAGPGDLPSPLEDRDLDPADYADRHALLRENRVYLEWEVALLEQSAGDPAAPWMRPGNE